MRSLVVVLGVIAATVGGGWAVMNRSSLPSFSLPKVPVSISQKDGEVKGDSVTITHRFDGVVGAMGKIGSTLGVKTSEVGTQVITNVTTTPSSSGEVIDMSKVVSQVRSSVESIPGNLVQQAKVEYCKQVLQDATASGKTN
jgi:hypothetical protein